MEGGEFGVQKMVLWAECLCSDSYVEILMPKEMGLWEVARS